MLRRIAPFVCVFLSVLLDTAVIPSLYYGNYLLPVSLIVIILIGIQLGRIRGMFFGLITGLLLDITCGTLGLKLYPYIAIGFLIGFLLDRQPQLSEAISSKERYQYLAVRAIWIFVLVFLYEIAMLVLQYFSNALFRWEYVRDLTIRAAAITLLCLLFYSPMRRILKGRSDDDHNRKAREVKHF